MGRFLIICKTSINNMEDSNKVNTFITEFYDILPYNLKKYKIIIVINIKSNDHLTEYRSYIKSSYNSMYIECHNVYDDTRNMKSIIISSMNTYMLSGDDLVTYLDFDSGEESQLSPIILSRLDKEKDIRPKIESM